MAKINSEIGENQNATPDMSAILSRLENIEAENKKLTEKLSEKDNMFKKGKEKYKWPRLYNYKMWGWIPVLSYESVKKDTTKDWIYKNQYWEYTSNHYLKLTLANKKDPLKVEVNEFNSAVTRSDKLECEVLSDGVSPTWYKFNTTDFWEFTVNPNIIN